MLIQRFPCELGIMMRKQLNGKIQMSLNNNIKMRVLLEMVELSLTLKAMITD